MRNYGNVVLDDCNFHENAQLETFDKDRMLTIVAPEGEVGSNWKGMLVNLTTGCICVEEPSCVRGCIEVNHSNQCPPEM